MIINRKNESLSNSGGTNICLFILVAALTVPSSIFVSCHPLQFGYSARNGRILKRLSPTSTPSGLLPSSILASGLFSEISGKQLHLKIQDYMHKNCLRCYENVHTFLNPQLLRYGVDSCKMYF